jgi:signal recognition particle receptor subunit beta
MVQINFATREVQCKVVYYGPARAGKTANLQSIHDKAPAHVHGNLTRLATDTDRTLFFDFLPLDLGPLAGIRTKVQLYGVPYIDSQNAVRVLVLEGVDAIVFVADSSRARLLQNVEALRNLEENLGRVGRSIDEIPLVFQWNKSDSDDAVPAAELDQALNAMGAPTFTANALAGTGVFRTLKAVTAAVLVKVTHGEDARPAPAALPPARVTREPEEEDAPPRPKIVPIGTPSLPDMEITSINEQVPHPVEPAPAAEVDDPLSMKLPVAEAAPFVEHAAPRPPAPAPAPPAPKPPPAAMSDDTSSVLDTPWGDVTHEGMDREPVTSDDLLADMQADRPVEAGPVEPPPAFAEPAPMEAFEEPAPAVYAEPEPGPADFDLFEPAAPAAPPPPAAETGAPRRHHADPFAAEIDAWAQERQEAEDEFDYSPTPVTDRRRRKRPQRIPTADLFAGSLVSLTSLIVIGYLVHLFL